MSAVTAPESEREPWCSICYHPLGSDDPLRTLSHVLNEHADHRDVQRFAREIEIGLHCAKCFSWYHSDLRVSRNGWFKAKGFCPDCRDENEAFRRSRATIVSERDVVKWGRLIIDGENDEQ